MRKLLAIVSLTALLGGSLALAKGAAQPPVKYPEGYRTWAHVKSMVIVSDQHPLFASFSGIHHIYANRVALQATKSQGVYPDGSVLVFDLLEASEVGGAYVEGARKMIGVMQKNSRRFKATGGWGFEAFKGGAASERLVKDPATQCFACHNAQKDNDFVFSRFRN